MVKYFSTIASAFALLVNAPVIAANKAAIQNPVPSGVYSDVKTSGETGDMGGFELELHAEGSQPFVYAVWCEGWCNTADRAPITWTKDGFIFVYEERSVTEEGAEHIDRSDFTAVRKGQKLMLSTGSGEGLIRFQLKRLKRRSGLMGTIPAE
jgi:hypothetical protein